MSTPNHTRATVDSGGDLPTVRRRHYARSLIDLACGQPVPRYGSSEWCSLPDGDPRRLAAVAIAAEAWASDTDDIEDRLHRELRDRWHAEKTCDDEDYAAAIETHRDRWSRLATVIPFAERRRRQIESARSRPSDFQGVRQ